MDLRCLPKQLDTVQRRPVTRAWCCLLLLGAAALQRCRQLVVACSVHCCCCCCCGWFCCRCSLGHDLAAKKQCPLSVDPGMVKKPAPGNRAGARGFAGRARGPSAPGVRGNGRVMHRRPRRWTPTAFPGGSSPATARKSHKKAKKFKILIGSTSFPSGTWFPRHKTGGVSASVCLMRLA